MRFIAQKQGVKRSSRVYIHSRFALARGRELK